MIKSHGKNILLVEDEERIAMLMKKGLEFEHYFVETACDGEEALKIARNKKFDLIIMDVLLPKMTGLEVTRKLRLKKISTPIIMVTARAATEERIRGLEAGADEYMVKPIAFYELVERIEELTEKRSAGARKIKF